ncbi:MAG TPA: 50S ribosomal protein L25/general stress protein Ctc [Alcanivoracaceae bacterium]|nr:50S ribosomal protein L25/general stress protein Ctc [Alcanivoracaceae bacterium]
MSDELRLEAQARTDVGKGASRRLRREQARVPGIVYGAGKDPQQISVEFRHLIKCLEDDLFYSQIVSLVIDGKKVPVILRDMQRHPSRGEPTHVDFMRIDESQELTVVIPINFLNEEKCVGVRINNGVLVRNLSDVEITCLPQNIPEALELDIAELDLGEMLHLSDIPLPEGVQISVLMYGDEDADQAVVSVNEPQAEEPEEDAVAEDSEDAAEDAEDQDGEEE